MLLLQSDGVYSIPREPVREALAAMGAHNAEWREQNRLGQPLRGVAVTCVALGCPKNDVDAEYMLGLLQAAGARVVDSPVEADVVLVNTCAFIQPAVEDAVEALLDVASLPDGRRRTILATGCLAPRYGRQLVEELPEVAAFVGPGDVPNIVGIVERALRGEKLFLSSDTRFIGSAALPRRRIEPPWRGTVKIADGCDHACTFCTIPRIRGPFRSRDPDDICQEVRRLVDEGAREICLVAQDSCSYGKDLGMDEGLARLLEQLAQTVGSGVWLRVQYLHPDRVSDATVDAILGIEQVVEYFDLPFQHASARVLQRMGRAGRGERYAELIAAVRERCPPAAVRATFIVGFPGEEEDDFHQLLEFVTATEPDHVSCFVYWAEEGTAAAGMAARPSSPVRRFRNEELAVTAYHVMTQRAEQFVGSCVDVLVEGEPEGQLVVGRTFRDAPDVDGVFHLSIGGGDADVRAGEFVAAQVTGAQGNDLYGKPVG